MFESESVFLLNYHIMYVSSFYIIMEPSRHSDAFETSIIGTVIKILSSRLSV